MAKKTDIECKQSVSELRDGEGARVREKEVEIPQASHTKQFLFKSTNIIGSSLFHLIENVPSCFFAKYSSRLFSYFFMMISNGAHEYISSYRLLFSSIDKHFGILFNE